MKSEQKFSNFLYFSIVITSIMQITKAISTLALLHQNLRPFSFFLPNTLKFVKESSVHLIVSVGLIRIHHIRSEIFLFIHFKLLTLIAENMGGTCHISPRKEAAAFLMSSSFMCSQGSR